jgi:hypothetical protein
MPPPSALLALFLDAPEKLAVTGQARMKRKSRFSPEHTHLYALWADLSNVKVCSSATKKMGVPPDEIETACASVCFPPSDAAHASRACFDGKYTSTMRWNGAGTLRRTHHLGGDDLSFPRQFFDSHRNMLVLIDFLKGFDVFRTRVHHDKLYIWHAILLIKIVI